ncbi:type II toxin-antitoxin system PemK/MazF family toxin, partial [Calditerricola satsumensis]
MTENVTVHSQKPSSSDQNTLLDQELNQDQDQNTPLPISQLKIKFNDFLSKINKDNFHKALEIVEWISIQLDLHDKAMQYRHQKHNDKNKCHPIRPVRGEIYMAELGSNVGSEFNSWHPVLIIQNDRGNTYSEKTIVLPMTGYKQNKRYDKNIYHKIYPDDFDEGQPNKISLVKIADITTIDKARLGRKVGKLNDHVMKMITDKLRKHLAIRTCQNKPGQTA